MADYIYLNPNRSEIPERHRLTDLKRLLQWDRGTLVGEHGARKTWKVVLEGPTGNAETFYIRQEHRIPLSEMFEDVSGFQRPSSRGFKTMQAVELFGAGGINVAPLDCLIERRHLGLPLRAAAVQREASGQDLYRELLEFGRPTVRTRNPVERQKLLYELGKTLAKISRGRIDWPDLVSKHFYVRRTGKTDPFWQFTLIDVERARPGLTPRKRDKQLSRFLMSLRGLLTPSDLMRVMRGYLDLDNALPRLVRRRLMQKFLPKGASWLRRARQEMAMLRIMPEHQPLPEEELYERVGGMVVNMRFKESLRSLGLLEKGKAFSFEQGKELYKPGLGRRMRMRFETLIDGNNVWLYMKRVRHPKLTDQIDRALCGTVRHSSCWHERYMIKQLGICRIPAPVVVGYAEKMFFGYERAGALVTEGLIGQSLEKFVPKHFKRAADRQETIRRREWTRQLGELIGRFHRAGFCHRDLYLSHVFIGFKQNGDPIFYLIDLARVFKMGWRKERWIVKDLAALNYSSPKGMIDAADRMRFIKTYLGKSKLEKSDKRLIRKIVAKTRQIASHAGKHRKVTQERTVT